MFSCATCPTTQCSMAHPLLFLPLLSAFLVLALALAKPPCETVEFTKGMKKPAGKEEAGSFLVGW